MYERDVIFIFSGRMVITAVGTNSHTGIIMALLGQTNGENGESESERNQSILQSKLTILAKRIGFFGEYLFLSLSNAHSFFHCLEIVVNSIEKFFKKADS